MGGTPKFVESQALPHFSYADFAVSVGLGALTVTEPDALADAWERALSADRPFVLDVHCDPDIPPIPPHATLEQMTSMAKALIKATPADGGSSRRASRPRSKRSCPTAKSRERRRSHVLGAPRRTVTSVAAPACTIPTDASEADGTLAWDSTALVLGPGASARDPVHGRAAPGSRDDHARTGPLQKRQNPRQRDCRGFCISAGGSARSGLVLDGLR